MSVATYFFMFNVMRIYLFMICAFLYEKEHAQELLVQIEQKQ